MKTRFELKTICTNTALQKKFAFFILNFKLEIETSLLMWSDDLLYCIMIAYNIPLKPIYMNEILYATIHK